MKCQWRNAFHHTLTVENILLPYLFPAFHVVGYERTRYNWIVIKLWEGKRLRFSYRNYMYFNLKRLWCIGKNTHFISDLGNSGFFSLWDPEIDGFTRYTERTGSWRRESMDILTFTIDHVWNLLKQKGMGGVCIFKNKLIKHYCGVSPLLPPCYARGWKMLLALGQ